MPTVPAAVATYLLTGSRPSVRDCITVTLATATVYRWCSGSANVVDGGVTWYANQVAIRRGPVTVEVDSHGDDLEINLANRPTYSTIDLVKAGMSLTFRRARVQLWEAFYDAEGGTYLGLVGPIFDGTVNEPEVPDGTYLRLTARNATAGGTETFPKHIVATACPYTYGDADCAATPITSSQHVHAGSSTTMVVANAVNATTMTPGGLITFTSGALNGVTAMIASVSGANLTIDQALGAIPAVNDTFTVTAGCDHSITRCNALNNIARCGACPYAPNQDNGLTSAGPVWVPGRISQPPAGGFSMNLKNSEGVPVPIIIGEAWVTPIVAYMVTAYAKEANVWGSSTLFDTPYLENPNAGGSHWTMMPSADCLLIIGQAPLTIVGVKKGNETNITEPYEALRRLAMHTRLATEDASSAADVLNDTIGMRPTAFEVVNGTSSVWGKRSAGRDLYTDITGASPPAWGHFAGTPAAGMAYANLAQLRYERIALPNSGRLPDFKVLVQSSHGKDVRPDTAVRYLMHDVLGIADADILTTTGIDGLAASSYKNYIDNQPSMRVNIAIEAHQDVWDVIDSLLQASNAERVQVGGKWRIQVLDDTAKGTYVPASTTVTIGQDDFAADSRIGVKFTPEDQVYNCIPVRFRDQGNDYKESVRTWADDADVRLHRLRRGPEVSNPWISTAAHATLLANIEVRKSQNRLRKFLLSLNKRLISLEPGKLITVGDAHEIDPFLARIFRVQYESDTIKVEAWESKQKGVTPIDITVQASAGTTPLPSVPPYSGQDDQIPTLETDAEDRDNLFPNGFTSKFPFGSDPSDTQWQDLYNAGAGAHGGSWVRRIVTTTPARWGALTPEYYCGTTGQWQGGIAVTGACSAGDTFSFLAWAKLAVKSNGSTLAQINCRFLDAAGSILAAAGTQATTGNTTWTQLTVTPTAPANSVKFVAYYEVNCTASITVGETGYFDDFSLTQNGGANLYPNPDCETAAPTPLYSDLTAASVPVAYRDLNAYAAYQGVAGRRITVAATTTQQIVELQADLLPCKPGDRYFFEAEIRCAQAKPGTMSTYYGCRPVVSFYDAFGNDLGSLATGYVATHTGSGYQGTTFTRSTFGSDAAPAGTVGMRMRLMCYAQMSSGTATVAFDFDTIHCRRMSAEEALVPPGDGTIDISWAANWGPWSVGTWENRISRSNRVVTLVISAQALAGAGTTILTLPTGYRPKHIMIAVAYCNGTFAYVTIGSDGSVALTSVVSGLYCFSASFLAEA